MFTEKSLFNATNQYHKFDKMQHMVSNKTYAITVVNDKRLQTRQQAYSNAVQSGRTKVSNFTSSSSTCAPAQD